MKKLVLFAGILVAVSFASCNSAKQEAPATDEPVAVEECCGKCEADSACCGKCENDSACCKADSCCGKCEADSACCEK